MPLQSLRALWKAPGGAGSIWKYLEVLVTAIGVSGRFVYGFWTELHFANVGIGEFPFLLSLLVLLYSKAS